MKLRSRHRQSICSNDNLKFNVITDRRTRMNQKKKEKEKANNLTNIECAIRHMAAVNAFYLICIIL